MHCTRHNIRNCAVSDCARQRREARASAASTPPANPLADPTSPQHQAAFGGAYYGSVETTPGPSPSTDCSPAPSSSHDSGTSTSSSYDGGSSSSDCGGGW